MAYTPNIQRNIKLPVEPAQIGPVRVTRATADVDLCVKIPWENCRLVYAYANTTMVVATANMAITLELDAAGGTSMATITLPTASSAIGDTAEWVVVSAAACKNLGRQDTSRDAINITVTGSDTHEGAADVYMWFEPELGQP